MSAITMSFKSMNDFFRCPRYFELRKFRVTNADAYEDTNMTTFFGNWVERGLVFGLEHKNCEAGIAYAAAHWNS